MNDVIDFRHVSKRFQLGVAGTGMLTQDIERWWKTKVLRQEDTYSRINSRSGTVWALKDVTLSISKGEVVGLIGHNGSGKSTLLKMLSRIIAPTEGEISYKGRLMSLLEVGTGFHPEMTGRENVYMNGAILGMKKAEIDERYDEIVRFSGIGRYIDTPVKRYSSGMAVRLGFSVAACMDPDILVVDEVLAVGDMDFQKKAIAKIKEIVGKKDRTVICVSHNLTLMRQLCTRCFVLNDGRIVFDGNISDAIEYYTKELKV